MRVEVKRGATQTVEGEKVSSSRRTEENTHVDRPITQQINVSTTPAYPVGLTVVFLISNLISLECAKKGDGEKFAPIHRRFCVPHMHVRTWLPNRSTPFNSPTWTLSYEYGMRIRGWVSWCIS